MWKVDKTTLIFLFAFQSLDLNQMRILNMLVGIQLYDSVANKFSWKN